EGVLQDRVDEFLAQREVAVERSDADTGVPGDLAHRDFNSASGEEITCSPDQPLAVSLRIDPASGGFAGRRHPGNLAKAERMLRFRYAACHARPCPLVFGPSP